jgi:hypothetical protein
MKVTVQPRPEQPLTQFLLGCDQQRDGLGVSLLDTWLHPLRAGGVDDSRRSRHPWAWRAGPRRRGSARRQAVEAWRWAQAPADPGIHEGQHGPCLQPAWPRLTVQPVQRRVHRSPKRVRGRFARA